MGRFGMAEIYSNAQSRASRALAGSRSLHGSALGRQRAPFAARGTCDDGTAVSSLSFAPRLRALIAAAGGRTSRSTLERASSDGGMAVAERI
jgi:hypothetical protein